MSQYTKEWCRTFYNTVRYMDWVYRRLEDSGSVKLNSMERQWWVEKDENDPDETSAWLYFTFWPSTLNKRQGEMGISISIAPNGPEAGYPLWINVECNNEALWNRLQAAFSEDVVAVDDDYWYIGLPLDIPADARDDQIYAMAKQMADKLIQVLEGLEQ